MRVPHSDLHLCFDISLSGGRAASGSLSSRINPSSPDLNRFVYRHICASDSLVNRHKHSRPVEKRLSKSIRILCCAASATAIHGATYLGTERELAPIACVGDYDNPRKMEMGDIQTFLFRAVVYLIGRGYDWVFKGCALTPVGAVLEHLKLGSGDLDYLHHRWLQRRASHHI